MKYHQKKTLVFQILDKLPSKLGYSIYHFLQKKSFNEFDSIIESNTNSMKKIKSILDHSNIDLKNQKIIEIGSGWTPLMPFLFKNEFEVSKIITYDINRHYSNKRIELTAQHFKNVNFESRKYSNLNLPNFIDYNPNKNIIDASIDKDVKLIYSRFVLEHVTPSDIKKMHEKFYKELNNDIKILHLISPSDHRAYSDASLSHYDFLQYSQEEWNRIQTKFDYHNRLRLPEYIDIFKNSGFKITYLEHDTAEKNSKKYDKFKEVKLHPDYHKFSEEEILAGSICILLEK